MKTLLGAAAAVALLAGGSATAQTTPVQYYGNIGYTQLSSDLEFEGSGIDAEDAEISVGAITGRVGARFGQYLGAEGELAFGITESEENIAGSFQGTSFTGTIDTKLNNEIAIFGVGFLPVAPNADVFARVGVGRSEFEIETNINVAGFSSSDSGARESNFFAYGLGGQYFFDGLNGVRGDYTRYDLEEEDDGGERAEFNAFSVSYVRKF